MPSRVVLKRTLQLPHPKMLLLRACLPPPLSTRERLGRRRQSNPFWSAAIRKSWANSCAGELFLRKNSLIMIHRASARAIILTCTGSGSARAGTASRPAATTKPREKDFVMREPHTSVFLFLIGEISVDGPSFGIRHG